MPNVLDLIHCLTCDHWYVPSQSDGNCPRCAQPMQPITMQAPVETPRGQLVDVEC